MHLWKKSSYDLVSHLHIGKQLESGVHSNLLTSEGGYYNAAVLLHFD